MLTKQISSELSAILDSFFRERGGDLEKAVDAIVKSLNAGGKILLFGNGGSAAEAQHFAAEMVTQFRKIERPAIPAIALSSDTACLTAIGNDSGFDRVFARQIEALGRPGDIAVALTTSGESPNVIEGLKTAAMKGMVTFTLTGTGGGQIRRKATRFSEAQARETRGKKDSKNEVNEDAEAVDSGQLSTPFVEVDFLLDVPSRSVPRIQEAHLVILHVLAEEIEKRFVHKG